jgi:shikimate kinase
MPETIADAERIVLIGMMGAGKTTVGRALAARLRWPMLDNDALIREATGRDGPTIFRDDGEEALHAAEREAFLTATRRPGPSIVTVAGSVVDDASLRDVLRTSGRVVWLRARPATLHDRIDSGAGRRADAVDEELLARLAAAREPRYRAVADDVVDVDDRPVTGVVDEILGSGPPQSAR